MTPHWKRLFLLFLSSFAYSVGAYGLIKTEVKRVETEVQVNPESKPLLEVGVLF